MARLISIVTRNPIDISVTIGQPTQIMGASHGWGISWYDGKKLNVKKGVRSVLSNQQNESIQESISTRTFMLHMRQATSGQISEKNTHPFSYKSFSFSHIGSVNKDLLLEKLTPPYNEKFQSEPIDSEVYFRYIVQEMEKTNPVDGIKNAVSVARSTTGADFILTNGEQTYGYRSGLPLFWMRWNYQQPISFTTPSGVTISSKGIAREPGYIIASDKILEGNWTALDDGELFIVQKNMQYETIKLL